MAGGLILPAPAKLNLRLRVTGRRADGMHLLAGETVLIDLHDNITLTPRPDGELVRDWRHPQVPPGEELSLRAARLLRHRAGCAASGVTITIDKRIPVGGGLGGASSDAATTLLGLNRLWRIDWSLSRLAALAAELGADVPFFLFGQAAHVGGIGERLTPLAITPRHYLLVFPPVAALTAHVFAEYQRGTNGQAPPPIESENDLTAAAVKLYPDILPAAAALAAVLAPPATVWLSGSGSTLFAAFDDAAAARQAQAALPAEIASAVAAGLVKHPLIRDNNGNER